MLTTTSLASTQTVYHSLWNNLLTSYMFLYLITLIESVLPENSTLDKKENKEKTDKAENQSFLDY